MDLFKSNKFFLFIMQSVGSIAALLVIMITVFVAMESVPIFNSGLPGFFTDPVWDPSLGLYNLFPMVLGSFLVTVGALLIAIPVSFLTAITLALPPLDRYGSYLRLFIEVMSGIPSVVFGFWGLVRIVPILYELAPPGANLLAGSIVLGVMLLPTLTVFFVDAIKSSPREWLLNGQALGLSQGSLVFKVLLPGISSQMKIGVLIALGRAIGETMAVLMVCGNIIKIPLSIFDPVRTLTANIALEMSYAMGHHRAALFASGFMLLLLVALLTFLIHRQRLRVESYARL